MADTVLTDLKIHDFDSLAQMSQYESEIGENDIVFTPDISCRLPLLTPMWFDHITNDMSWLRADTFSWQSGDVYVAAYAHLTDDLDVVPAIVVTDGSTYPVYVRYMDGDVSDARNPYCWRHSEMGYVYTSDESPSVNDYVYSTATGAGSSGYIYSKGTRPSMFAQTDTIGDISITYYQAQDGHKICLPDQESNLVALYEKTGAADYYLLDMTNKQFKLPRKHKRTLIQAVKNDDGTWYNLYSDGWVEQGGHLAGAQTTTVPLLVAMADRHYFVGLTANDGGTATNYRISCATITTTSFVATGTVAITKEWTVKGYASESAYASAGMRLEYYFVGNFEQSAAEQTAGITSETLNGKADADLGNIPANYDYVVESQLPTDANGYTWYRKYKSGWVEQGGRCTVPATNAYSASSVTVTLPVPIQIPESAVLSYSGLNSSEKFANCENQASLTTTTVTIGRWNNGNSTAATRSYMWVLYGQAE